MNPRAEPEPELRVPLPAQLTEIACSSRMALIQEQGTSAKTPFHQKRALSQGIFLAHAIGSGGDGKFQTLSSYSYGEKIFPDPKDLSKTTIQEERRVQHFICHALSLCLGRA